MCILVLEVRPVGTLVISQILIPVESRLVGGLKTKMLYITQTGL